MRFFVASVILACGGPAEAGDLWMTFDSVKPGEEIHLHLPANWVADAEEPIQVDTARGTIDLRTEARALRQRKVGSETRVDLDADGGTPVTLTLHHVALTGGPATQLEIQTLGPKGNGLTMTMELTKDQLAVAHGQLDAVVDLDGLKLDVDDALCRQLRASPPSELLVTKGPKGGGIRVATR